jgi:hypothetical protein
LGTISDGGGETMQPARTRPLLYYGLCGSIATTALTGAELFLQAVWHAGYMGCLALGALALTMLLWQVNPIASGLLFVYLVLFAVVPSLMRALHRWPSLIVSSEGLTDLASAQVVGFGLIPWHEIDGLYYVQMRDGMRERFQLIIEPVNYGRLLKRQPIVKRHFCGASGTAAGRCPLDHGCCLIHLSKSTSASVSS